MSAIRLKRLSLRGFRTIRELDKFEVAPLTVLIGANGAGKSNFIALFKLLAAVASGPQRLQLHVAKNGRASTFLHDGPSVTQQIEAQLVLETEVETIDYALNLSYAAGDTLIVSEEKYRRSPAGSGAYGSWIPLEIGINKSAHTEQEDHDGEIAKVIASMFARLAVYQFNDTSFTSSLRQSSSTADNARLREGGANLASLLRRLKNHRRKYYERIVRTLRQILPYFADFELKPESGRLMLRWRECDSDMVFGAHQASDGMLRTIALVTLLLQPKEDLPALLILDEPELGLHPYAIHLVAGLIRSASVSTQVLVATQSTNFVDQFEPRDIVVVDRHGRESTFKRLKAKPLEDWLKEYSLSELWEKNVVGGRPGR